MAQSSGKALMQWMVAALLFAMLGSSLAVIICNIDSNQLKLCRAAVSGRNPPNPSNECCDVIRRANLPCLCSYKSILPSFGINGAKALALPGKCGLKTPSNC
ncbi:hypothetical protein TSUD_257860 [Trifolium subterraneum]|uniref:Bifunctional inhibitor/plant lipid transfer protein/seed storage helical domain-containing protein n=1 Tax=Trifolium subterraneum TaxID=3900 RepID=A0A2Z6MIF3_TRISU|nr:hypothetical protein TSUD_257860 [Trifolium subterraneum]